MKYLKHFIHHWFQKNEIAIHELNYLFWECTRRCNLSCLHCGSDCQSDSINPDMPFDDFLRSIQSIKKQNKKELPIIAITGGEPLLRTDLATCGKKLRAEGFAWGIVTNGLLYTSEKHRELLDAGMCSITVSIDGMENTHNFLRRNPHSFQRAIAALTLISREKKLNYDVVTCVHGKNLSELSQLKQLFIERGIKSWRIFTIAPIGRAKKNPDLQLNSIQLITLFDFISATRKEGCIDIKFSCEAYTGHYEEVIRDSYFFCRAGINIASILIDGSISVCPNASRAFIQGNIYHDDLCDIWEKKFQVMRDRKWMRNGICSQCHDFRHCQGGAIHLRKDLQSSITHCICRSIEK